MSDPCGGRRSPLGLGLAQVHSLLARLLLVWVTCQSHSRLIDLSKRDTYDGAHSAIVVDNFFFGLEQYFDVMSVRDEESKVSLYSYEAPHNYSAAKHREIGNGICTINTWAKFQQELRKQFAPSTRRRNNVRNYINDFTTFVLEISNMFDKDSLFYFQDGLKDWARVELNRLGVQTLDDAITIAESLADYFAQCKDKEA